MPMQPKPKRPHPHTVTDPTPAQIAELEREIQAGWTDDERLRRTPEHLQPIGWELPRMSSPNHRVIEADG